MTKTVTLSGGNFGGASVQWPDGTSIVRGSSSMRFRRASVQWPDGTSIVSVNDGAGTFWNYDITLHTDAAERADFCGCTTAAAGPVVKA